MRMHVLAGHRVQQKQSQQDVGAPEKSSTWITLCFSRRVDLYYVMTTSKIIQCSFNVLFPRSSRTLCLCMSREPVHNLVILIAHTSVLICYGRRRKMLCVSSLRAEGDCLQVASYCNHVTFLVTFSLTCPFWSPWFPLKFGTGTEGCFKDPPSVCLQHKVGDNDGS